MSVVIKPSKEVRRVRLARARKANRENYHQAFKLAETMRLAGMDSRKAIASIILAHDLSTRDAKRVWEASGPKKKRTRK